MYDIHPQLTSRVIDNRVYRVVSDQVKVKPLDQVFVPLRFDNLNDQLLDQIRGQLKDQFDNKLEEDQHVSD